MSIHHTHDKFIEGVYNETARYSVTFAIRERLRIAGAASNLGVFPYLAEILFSKWLIYSLHVCQHCRQFWVHHSCIGSHHTRWCNILYIYILIYFIYIWHAGNTPYINIKLMPAGGKTCWQNAGIIFDLLDFVPKSTLCQGFLRFFSSLFVPKSHPKVEILVEFWKYLQFQTFVLW